MKVIVKSSRGRSRFVLRTLLFTLLALAIARTHAEEMLRLINYTDVWKYNQDGVAAPAGWNQPAFDDSRWLSGQGVFGFPVDEPMGGVAPLQTLLSVRGTNGIQEVITYYFRKQFTFPYDADNHVVLISSNLIDDGAVFYLNGTEVGRIRLPAGSVVYPTIATGNREVSSGPEVLTFPRTALRRGTNTLAVELHQVAITNNGDAVSGLSLTARILDPIQIVREPEDVTIEEGQTLYLSVDVTGSDPRYQWYRNGVILPNFPTRELIWQNISTNQAGNYSVVVTNNVNTARSRSAKVTVLPDRRPPVLLGAEEYLPPGFMTGSNFVLLTFSEPLARFVATNNSLSATNSSNYVVHEYGTTNVFAVTNAVNSGNQVRVRVLGDLNKNSLYYVVVTNVADSRYNVIAQPAIAYVGFFAFTNLVSLSSPWAWDESGGDLGTAWREASYDDSGWPRGPGVFAYEFDAIDYCGGVKDTALSLGPVTYYFRYPFFVPWTSGKVIFNWREAIDDGAIFYLNGKEIRRVNMPTNGVITAATMATTVREGSCSIPISVLASNLVSGMNVLAVEVHQAAAMDFDVVFGMQVDASIQLPYPKAVPLEIARRASGEVMALWNGNGGLLEGAMTPDGPWSPVGTNSPVVLSPNLPASFFRLVFLAP